MGGLDPLAECTNFSVSECGCRVHQRLAFCKHVAAAIAFVENMRAPPPEVMHPVHWNRKVLKKLAADESLVFQMLRNCDRRESRSLAARGRSPCASPFLCQTWSNLSRPIDFQKAAQSVRCCSAAREARPCTRAESEPAANPPARAQ